MGFFRQVSGPFELETGSFGGRGGAGFKLGATFIKFFPAEYHAQSAIWAAELGLPFAFASHFAPDFLPEALAIYRRGFRPSAQLAEPHVIVGVNVFAANTDAIIFD